MRDVMHRRRSLGRFRTCDTAIQFRMVAGFPGEVNRGHPASILPNLPDPANPPTAYGQPVVVNPATGGVRVMNAGDLAVTDIWGTTVRPYPIQQPTTNQQYGAVNYGSVAPPTAQPIDVMRGGYMIVAVNGVPQRGAAVFIWTAASAGAHVQGGFEAAATGGSTAALLATKYYWNSPPDASGNAELIINF